MISSLRFRAVGSLTLVVSVSLGACTVDNRALIETDEMGQPVNRGSSTGTTTGSSTGTTTGMTTGTVTGDPEPDPLPDPFDVCLVETTEAPAFVENVSAEATLGCAADGFWGDNGIGYQPAEGNAGPFYGAVFSVVEQASRSEHCQIESDFAPLCVSGALQPLGTSWGVVGWNLRQGFSEDCLTGAENEEDADISFSQSVYVHVEVDPSTTVPVRLQARVEGDRYFCTDTFSGSVAMEVPFSEFTENCWAGGGTPLTNDMRVSQVAVHLAPSRAQITSGTPAEYDLCLHDMRIH